MKQIRLILSFLMIVAMIFLGNFILDASDTTSFPLTLKDLQNAHQKDFVVALAASFS